MRSKSEVESAITRSKKYALKGGAYKDLRKKYDGKYYYSVGGIHDTNSAAQKTAEKVRGFGYNARVHKGVGAGGRGIGYYIYAR